MYVVSLNAHVHIIDLNVQMPKLCETLHDAFATLFMVHVPLASVARRPRDSEWSTGSREKRFSSHMFADLTFTI